MMENDKNKCLSQNEINFFLNNGYLLIKNVYDRNELLKARKLFESAFEQEVWKVSKFNSKSIINDAYQMFPWLLEIVINEKFVICLKAILGERLIWLPESAIHCNRFTNWHRDTTEQEIRGISSHKMTNEYLIQCATYFQSSSDVGGGLHVFPGSHLSYDPFTKLYKKDFYHRLLNKVKKLLKISVFDKLNKDKRIVQIPSEAGDLLIFDVRLYHKSTQRNKMSEITKFAIFNTFGNDNLFTKDYLEFMKKRPEPYYRFLKENSFPSSLYKKATSLNIKIWE